MLQVLDYGNRATKAGSSIGSAMGQGVGKGLSGALGQYANIKINDILQRKQDEHEERLRGQEASRWSDVLTKAGYSKESAQLIGMERDPRQREALMELLSPKGQEQEESQIAENMNNGQGQPIAAATAMQGPQEQQSSMGMYPLPGERLSPTPRMTTSGTPPQGSQAQGSQAQGESINNAGAVAGDKPLTSAQLIGRSLTSKQRLEERNAIIKEKHYVQQAAIKEQETVDEKVKPYAELLDKKGGDAADSSDMILDRMTKLIDKGKLTSAAMHNFAKKMEQSGSVIGGGLGTALGAAVGTAVAPGAGSIAGASIGAGLGSAAGASLMPKFVGTKEDQEFTKLSLSFLDKLKDMFGTKPAVEEVKMYMDSIPTLALTDEGKRAVIRDMKLIASGWRYKKEIKDKIVKENNGHYPADLNLQVNELSKPYMDRIRNQFINGLGLSL